MGQIAILSSFLLFMASCSGSSGSSGDTKTDECGLKSGQVGVKICEIVAEPTDQESISLKNYGESSVALDGWYLWDANSFSNESGGKSLAGVELEPGEIKTFEELPFQINNTGETITLTDADDVIVHERNN